MSVRTRAACDDRPGPLRFLVPAGLLLAAALAQGLFGYLFFGSIDMVNTVGNGRTTLDGTGFFYGPGFPVLPAFFRIGASLNVATDLPLAFCYKVVPILFGASLALVVHEFLRARGSGSPGRKALLFALCPIPTLVTSLHAQWDAICLFFLALAFVVRETRPPGRARQMLFGALFASAIAVKPYPLMLVFAFLEPLHLRRRDGVSAYRSRQAWAVAGAAGALGLFFTVFWLAGYDLVRMVKRVLDYSAGGVQIFGLPFNPGLRVVLKNRVWLMGVVGVLSVAYHQGKVDAFGFILMAFLAALGLGGLCPQYLLWPVPFLALAGTPRLFALYAVPASVFLVLYYLCPDASYVSWENMLTYVPLSSAGWLLPPAGWATQAWLLPVVKAFGNVLFPAICLGLAFQLWRAARRREPAGAESAPASVPWTRIGVHALPVLLTLFAVVASHDSAFTVGALDRAYATKAPGYALDVLATPSPRILAGYAAPGRASIYNGVTLLIAWTAAWGGAALLEPRRARSRVSGSIEPIPS